MAKEIRAVCPQCESVTLTGRVDAKFYYNTETLLGFCHHCGFKGKFEGDEFVESLNVVDIQTKKTFDLTAYEKLSPLNDVATRYLEKRFPGANIAEIANSFGLRYCPTRHAIAIPLGGRGIKYRHLADQNMRFSAEEGSQFGGYWLEGKADKLLIVEGELDAITAKISGFKGTVLALQTNKLSQESATRVKEFKFIFTCLDNDKAGAEGTALIQSLTFNKEVTEIKLPEGIKDVNELLQNQGIESAAKFIERATQNALERDTLQLSSSLGEMVSFLSDRRNTKGDPSGWNALDYVLGGGFRPREMTVINAFAKTGKTSFINNIIHNLAATNKKVAVASFEMDPARTLYPSLLSIAAQTNIRKIRDSAELTETVTMISQECAYLENIITLKRFGYTPWSEIAEWAALMKEQHQIEYLVLDHAGFMVEKMTDAEENQTLAKNIKKLTNTLGLHIFVVVQAPKTKDGMSIQTSYGGLAWAMNCDNYVILERDKTDETLLKVRLEAARYPGAITTSDPLHLFYDRETLTLSE